MNKMSKYKNITISKISNSTPMLSTKQQIVYDIYSNEGLVSMTKELTDSLRKNRTIDWQKKESVLAGMRRMIKFLLKRYHYSSEEVANALETVIKQCEQWTDNEQIIIQKNQPKCMKVMRMKYRWQQNYNFLRDRYC
jgi:type I restriction-modification system